MRRNHKHKLIGDQNFYKMVLGISLPIMVQNGITNLVSFLDNIMVGRIGTEPMTGIAIVNQLIFVYNLCVFGVVSGAGIFTAQFSGQKDYEGVANTMRFKLLMTILFTGIAAVSLCFFGETLIEIYLRGSKDGGDTAAALKYGQEYLKIVLLGLPPFMLVQVYASTLRECGSTLMPMKASAAAVLVNLVFNYLLIYGNLGFPKLGVTGAAIATAISRYTEAVLVLGWTYKHKEENRYIVGLYRTMKIPLRLAKQIFIKGTPLLLNETLWAIGVAALMQCYSVRGMNVVAGMNISNTVSNLFNIVFIALGDSVAIVVGQLLGAGKMEEAKDTDRKMIVFSVMCCIVMAVFMLFIAPLFPRLYHTNMQSREYARFFIIVTAVFMPQNAFFHAAYYTLRSGGKTVITFLFDSGFVCCVSVPVAYILGHFTDLHIVLIFTIVQVADIVKCIIGFVLVKKGVWLQKIVTE